MSNVLVTGGAGFIGSHVAKWLVKALSGDLIHNVPLDERIAKMAAWSKSLKPSRLR